MNRVILIIFVCAAAVVMAFGQKGENVPAPYDYGKWQKKMMETYSFVNVLDSIRVGNVVIYPNKIVVITSDSAKIWVKHDTIALFRYAVADSESLIITPNKITFKKDPHSGGPWRTVSLNIAAGWAAAYLECAGSFMVSGDFQVGSSISASGGWNRIVFDGGHGMLFGPTSSAERTLFFGPRVVINYQAYNLTNYDTSRAVVIDTNRIEMKNPGSWIKSGELRPQVVIYNALQGQPTVSFAVTTSGEENYLCFTGATSINDSIYLDSVWVYATFAAEVDTIDSLRMYKGFTRSGGDETSTLIFGDATNWGNGDAGSTSHSYIVNKAFLSTTRLNFKWWAKTGRTGLWLKTVICYCHYK